MDLINLFDWWTVLFIVSLGEFTKKITVGFKLHHFISHFWQVVLFVTPFAIGFAYYRRLKLDTFVLSYLAAFWLYQAIVKKIKDKIQNYGS